MIIIIIISIAGLASHHVPFPKSVNVPRMGERYLLRREQIDNDNETDNLVNKTLFDELLVLLKLGWGGTILFVLFAVSRLYIQLGQVAVPLAEKRYWVDPLTTTYYYYHHYYYYD